MKNLRIGQLATRAGIGVETIRFYERERLLPEPRRSVSGYRYYDEAATQRLNFIRRAKRLGFSLAEIRDLLCLQDDAGGDRAQVRALARDKLERIEQRIDDLQRIQSELSALVKRCNGRGRVGGCPIIEALHETGNDNGNTHCE